MLSHGFTWWGMLLQGMAILHFIRRRPDTYWLYIIIIAGWLGAVVYIAVELIPDLGLLRGTFQAFPRRKRIRELQALILDNPSAGNYEELAGLFQDEKKYAQARECYDKAITVRTDSPDPFYRRAQCATTRKSRLAYRLALTSGSWPIGATLAGILSPPVGSIGPFCEPGMAGGGVGPQADSVRLTSNRQMRDFMVQACFLVVCFSA